MSLLDTLRNSVPFLRPRQGLPRSDMLALRPKRNPAVTWKRREEERGEDDDLRGPQVGAVLTIPYRRDRLGRWLGRWFQMPDSKAVELDEFGAEIWELCDGAHSVEQLVKHTCTAYKLNRRQGEISVVAFMRMLLQRRLVGFLSAPSEGAKMGGKGPAHVSPKPVRPSGRRRQQRSVAARRRRN